MSGILGIHHVTAIASDPQPNLDFCIRFLGLRLVKLTVNFDDPGTYHFYYGDRAGRPGTLLTFFPRPTTGRGRHGTGQVVATRFAVPPGSAEFWTERAQRYGFEADAREDMLRIVDPDGLAVELVASARAEGGEDGLEVPAEYAIRGLAGAELAVAEPERTVDLLTSLLGFREVSREEQRVRLSLGEQTLDVTTAGKRGLRGAGTVDHIAFRTPDDEQQGDVADEVRRAGYEVTPVKDRKYFRSVYFREPGGILFEIATDGPGFTVDEPFDSLGSELKLPPAFESKRSILPPITVPVSGMVTESY